MVTKEPLPKKYLICFQPINTANVNYFVIAMDRSLNSLSVTVGEFGREVKRSCIKYGQLPGYVDSTYVIELTVQRFRKCAISFIVMNHLVESFTENPVNGMNTLRNFVKELFPTVDQVEQELRMKCIEVNDDVKSRIALKIECIQSSLLLQNFDNPFSMSEYIKALECVQEYVTAWQAASVVDQRTSVVI